MKIQYMVKSRFPTDRQTILDMPLAAFMSTSLVQDRSQAGNHGSATNDGGSGNPTPEYPGFSFTATSKHLIDIGNAGNGIKTISAWIKPVAVNVALDPMINLNDTDSLFVSSGVLTVTGLATGKILYTDGVTGTAITTAWHHVAVTTTAGFNATGFEIGQFSSFNFNGLISDVMLFARTLSPVEIASIYQLQRHIYNV